MARWRVVCRAALLIPLDKLAEATQFTIVRCVLVRKCEVRFFKLFEEIFPFNRLQPFVHAVDWKIDAQHTGLAVGSCTFHGCRAATSLLDPRPNNFVIGGFLCGCHGGRFSLCGATLGAEGRTSAALDGGRPLDRSARTPLTRGAAI